MWDNCRPGADPTKSRHRRDTVARQLDRLILVGTFNRQRRKSVHDITACGGGEFRRWRAANTGRDWRVIDSREFVPKSDDINEGIVGSGSRPRDGAMSERSRWLSVIVISGLIATGLATPALARDGVNTFGVAGFPSGLVVHAPRPFMRNSIVTPHIVARSADVQNDVRFRRHTRLQNGLPIIWPYASFTDATPLDVPPSQNEGPSSPSVIVMSSLPNGVPDRVVPETPPDYGYVAGCRPIPNGYHCDAPHNGTAASPGG